MVHDQMNLTPKATQNRESELIQKVLLPVPKNNSSSVTEFCTASNSDVCISRKGMSMRYNMMPGLCCHQNQRSRMRNRAQVQTDSIGLGEAKLNRAMMNTALTTLE